MTDKRAVVRRNVELVEEDLRWFHETYPTGSLTGVVSMLFSKFREVHDITPADYAALAARELKALGMSEEDV